MDQGNNNKVIINRKKSKSSAPAPSPYQNPRAKDDSVMQNKV